MCCRRRKEAGFAWMNGKWRIKTKDLFPRGHQEASMGWMLCWNLVFDAFCLMTWKKMLKSEVRVC